MKIRLAATFAVASLLSLGAQADTYPSQAITVVVPFPAGGTLDNLTRAVGQKLNDSVKQPVVVDNRPGAGTTIGTEFVARAKPNGYTLGMIANSFTINPSLYENLKYKTPEDFTPVAMLAYTPHILVARPNLPLGDLTQVVDAAKKTPGKLTFASFGSGTSSHIAIEVFKSAAKIDLVHVPYKGQAPALNDLLGGHVDMMFANLPDVLPHVQSGKLRAIAVVNEERVKLAPAIPTFKESGFPGFKSNSWYGVVAPKGTPADVVAKLSDEFKRILTAEDMKKRLSDQGLEVSSLSTREFNEFLMEEIRKSEKIVKASGATAN